ncbi:hypothetical protein L596_024560 [Steinernema carpocapsae]|uniref:Tyrosine-protein phosphatase domain-containing protein n=1 Tax=Steinernema carpocapsae TaxID=34508 RepID=A0A4U5MH26_STECR|nr:hypothetical protein L596_024560 [Steinernema carpocapsae]
MLTKKRKSHKSVETAEDAPKTSKSSMSIAKDPKTSLSVMKSVGTQSARTDLSAHSMEENSVRAIESQIQKLNAEAASQKKPEALSKDKPGYKYRGVNSRHKSSQAAKKTSSMSRKSSVAVVSKSHIEAESSSSVRTTTVSGGSSRRRPQGSKGSIKRVNLSKLRHEANGTSSNDSPPATQSPTTNSSSASAAKKRLATSKSKVVQIRPASIKRSQMSIATAQKKPPKKNPQASPNAGSSPQKSHVDKGSPERAFGTDNSQMSKSLQSLQLTTSVTQDDSFDARKSLSSGHSLQFSNVPLFHRRLRAFVNECLKSSIKSLHTEYDELRFVPTEQQSRIGRLEENAAKNRYTDIFCLDSTRVILSFPNNSESEDYIHANYVSGRNLRNKYILTQGPMMKTIADFWRMIWQEKCGTIVMVCKNIEDNKKKCSEYLPSEEKKLRIAGIEIQQKSQTWKKNQLRETILEMRYKGELRTVIHWQWSGWPDHLVPSKDLQNCFRLLQSGRRNSTTVIHCSAGIGRSGTLMALEICLTDLMQGEHTNVFEVVKFLRRQRAHSVQTFSQYLFIHRALLQFAVYCKTVSAEKIQPFVDLFQSYMSTK